MSKNTKISSARRSSGETITIKPTGKVLDSLRAIAFVSGASLEEVTLDVLTGIDNRHQDIAELQRDAEMLIASDEDYPAMIERLKQYRDEHVPGHSDESIEIRRAEYFGEISFKEASERLKGLYKKGSMTTSTTPITLEQYKQASRDELEAVIEKIARIEQAADIEPGSMVEGLLSDFFGEGISADDVIGYLEEGWTRKSPTPDWQERVREVVEG